MSHVAVMIDGGFYLKRFTTLYPEIDAHDPDLVAERIRWLVSNHLQNLNKEHCVENYWSLLYRSFYYDARPYVHNGQLPVSRTAVNYAKSPEAKFRNALFSKLRRSPNMAVRLGEVRKDGNRSWVLKPKAQSALLSGERNVSDLQDSDFTPALRQKGVDMRLGVDMASLALKGMVNTIVLVTGDADFVPAAKLARREGIRIVLDPLWQNVDDGLFEHIDRLFSGAARPGNGAA